MASVAVSRLVTGQRRRGQLPAEVTGFVGRQAELARLAAALSSYRLVTVTGPGGVGKTRIGLRAAARTADRYPGGVCFVELSALSDPRMLPRAVADRLGPREDGPPEDRHPEDGPREDGGLAGVLGRLRDRRPLLVLDTCEHIVDGCATFAEAVLREAPGVALLVTGRQPLDVPGEHVLFIPPLAAAGPDGTSDAVELFEQRAVAAVPSFRVTAETRRDVARLCRRLDGIPLAIELAAVRLRALPLHELVSRLEHRFQVLDGGRRGAVPRHQTLRTSIGWSYDLCTPAERSLWARLSVFAGTFDIAAAGQVCATGQPPGDGGPRADSAEIVEPLIGLVDKSVVLRDDAHGARYLLPGTPREFGALLLAADGTADAFRARHLSCQLAAARRFRDEFLGNGQRDLYRRLSIVHDDLLAALEYGLDRGGADTAELATALQAYWVISGRLREGRSWLAKAAHSTIPSPERAGALIARAWLGAFQGEASDAVRDAREGIEIAGELGDDRLEARGHLSLHAALTFGGWHEEAAAAGTEAERRLTALRDPTGLALFAVQHAQLLQLAGRPEQAIGQCGRTLRRLGGGADGTDGGERWLHGQLYAIAALARAQMPGEEERCAANAVRALRAAHGLGDVLGAAFAIEVLAWIAAADGLPERAAWLTGAADPLWERTGKRLSGSAVMLESHRRAVKAAMDALGGERFAALRARGAACPPEAAVAMIVDRAAGPGTGAWPDIGEASPADRGADGRGASRAGLGGLTGRERQIAELVASGLSNREIAARLIISKRTVDAHVEHIFGKLGLTSRVQLAIRLSARSPRHPGPTDERPRPRAGGGAR